MGSTMDHESAKGRRRVVRLGGQSIELGGFSILLMLIAVLLPAVMYSTGLREFTPAELLVAICIGMFASVLFLWILDVTDTLSFRSPWVSRSVYAAAIASVLGTSVGVYKDSFGDPYPYQGAWLLTVIDDSGSTLIARRPVALVYDRQTDVYWGYGDRPSSVGGASWWVAVTAYSPRPGRIEIQIAGGPDSVNEIVIAEERPKEPYLFTTTLGKEYTIRLSRPR